MKFILTKELGRLVKWLRILGFDAKYFTQNKESSLIIEALRDDRVILTRNERMGEHTGIKKVNIKPDNVFKQIKQVMDDLKIKPDESLMFSRCTICNEELKPIEKEIVKEKVPKYVFEANNDFLFCPNCDRIYWQGSHWGNVKKVLGELTSSF